MIVFAREPIFTEKGRVFAYQLTFRDGIDSAFAKTITEQTIEQSENSGVAWTELLEGYLSIISLSFTQLMNDIPEDLSPADTLFEIDCIEENNEDVLTRISELKALGFRFVCSEKKFVNKLTLKYVDYVKVSMNRVAPMDVKKLRQQTINNNLKIIVTDVQTHENFERCKPHEFDYYQGFFFLSRKEEPTKDLPASHIAMLDLISQLAKSELDIPKINAIFEHDATLSYLLFRFINNPMVNKSHQINSIKHAINYLGEVMLRKFVAIVSLTHINTGNTTELLHVSLIRARFCELLTQHNGGKKASVSGFLTGLFSLIDVILDRDINELMQKVTLAPEIETALVDKKGALHDMVRLCIGFESAHWDTTFKAAGELSLSTNEANQYFQSAIKWANSFSIPVSKDYPVTKVR
ncbi:EAL and HDOD domain-containing protein [Agaribacter marinus]|uniref:Diguanylate phosphodiesterase n=1 Tax=Agaribacter marinus TaxID=1431249 RepID=A0AA37T2I5_9ALTE|nr:HDOD domain-containing protein [Agaribacter marinus]GLR72371.1 diguanylate phosphodiesterase [Agaribacter marinus]